jgi:signal transduction histidine kinase/CheY-like chemotaxis protein
MKTRSLIITISVIASILVLLFSYVFQYAAGSKDKLLLQNSFVELKTGATNILQSKTTQTEKYIYDNSYWTELLNATVKKDSTWFLEEFVPGIKNYTLNYMWVLNENGDLIYNKDVGINSDISLFDINKNALLEKLKNTPFQNFFIKYNGNIIHVLIAPIQPSSDAKRVTIPKGYLILGKRYDAAFAKEFSNIAPGTNFRIIEDVSSVYDSINYKNYSADYRQYFNDFNGNKIAALKAEKSFSIINSYNKNLNTYIFLYLIFLFILLVSYYYFLKLKVLNPIAILSNALSKKDSSNLNILKFKKDEFADLAYMIDDSFVKNKQLQLEIDLRKKTEDELKKSAFELERATIDKIRAEQDKIAKAEFLSTMSHEIRTPINGVIGVANLLKSENLTPAQKELVNTLSFSSNHLLAVVTDILDFSKIESGNITFDTVQFNLQEVCKNVIGLFHPSASAKNINLTFENDNNVAEYLTGDSVRLCQILNNLVGNAIKFTDSGKIMLSYKLVNQIDNKQIVLFSITDTGIGIANEKLHSIFDSFSQADKTITTTYGGTGLGLSITKKLIEFQGGSIDVNSIVNEGTVFTFQLSFDIVNTTYYQSEKITKEYSTPNLYALRILVAEDNRINALILNKFLLKWNARMELAANGEEAIEKLQTNNYDLILMDLHMPIMDGREATKRIRENKVATYNTIPIVALTADATSETQKQILSLGFNEYVTKPFDPNNLYTVLEKFCNNKAQS